MQAELNHRPSNVRSHIFRTLSFSVLLVALYYTAEYNKARPSVYGICWEMTP
jgi:hypothetical protein